MGCADQANGFASLIKTQFGDGMDNTFLAIAPGDAVLDVELLLLRDRSFNGLLDPFPVVGMDERCKKASKVGSKWPEATPKI